jgi:hypothetical protein
LLFRAARCHAANPSCLSLRPGGHQMVPSWRPAAPAPPSGFCCTRNP